LATFNFPNHTPRTIYPNTGVLVGLANGWSFAVAPTAPVARTFELTFAAMRYYLNPDDTFDITTDAANNLGALEAFFNANLLDKDFVYPHANLGNIQCRFKTPLELPKIKLRGGGWSEPFTVMLQEKPL